MQLLILLHWCVAMHAQHCSIAVFTPLQQGKPRSHEGLPHIVTWGLCEWWALLLNWLQISFWAEAHHMAGMPLPAAQPNMLGRLPKVPGDPCAASFRRLLRFCPLGTSNESTPVVGPLVVGLPPLLPPPPPELLPGVHAPLPSQLPSPAAVLHLAPATFCL